MMQREVHRPAEFLFEDLVSYGCIRFRVRITRTWIMSHFVNTT